MSSSTSFPSRRARLSLANVVSAGHGGSNSGLAVMTMRTRCVGASVSMRPSSSRVDGSAQWMSSKTARTRRCRAPPPSRPSMPRTSAASVPGAQARASHHWTRRWRAARREQGVSLRPKPPATRALPSGGRECLRRSLAVDPEHSLELLDHGMERTTRVVGRCLEDQASPFVADSPAQLVDETRLPIPARRRRGPPDLSPRTLAASALP